MPVALVRDTILGRLSLAQPDELLTAEGKTKLRRASCRPCSSALPSWEWRKFISLSF